jgi:hypothetical protein
MRLILFVIVCAGMLCAAPFVQALLFPVWWWAMQRPFDVTDWYSTPEDERIYMVNDLMENVLPGKSEEEIAALLGPPLRKVHAPVTEPRWWVGLEAPPKFLWRDWKCVLVDFGESKVARPETIKLVDCP